MVFVFSCFVLQMEKVAAPGKDPVVVGVGLTGTGKEAPWGKAGSGHRRRGLALRGGLCSSRGSGRAGMCPGPVEALCRPPRLHGEMGSGPAAVSASEGAGRGGTQWRFEEGGNVSASVWGRPSGGPERNMLCAAGGAAALTPSGERPFPAAAAVPGL